MDPRRFDAVARTLGRSVDRRTALRGALAALLGVGLGPARDSAAACVATGKACGGVNGECCADGICDAKSKKCLGLAGASCRLSSNCAPGMLCKGGVCGGALVCRNMRESCAPVGNACCATMVCDGSQRVCLIDLGYACQANADCANGAVCRGGVCAAKGKAGEACDEDADCVSDLTCNAGACGAPVIGECSADADCGDGRICVDHSCIVPECPEYPCNDGRICWDGLCITPKSCEADDAPDPCWQMFDGTRSSGGAYGGDPCDADDDCTDSSVCTNFANSSYYGRVCVCLKNVYQAGEFDQNLGICGAMLLDRSIGDGCRKGAECGAGLHCDNGLCRAAVNGECSLSQDCPDAGNSACCDGVCHVVNQGNLTHCGGCGNACAANQLCCDWFCIDVEPGTIYCPD
jgi:hypothetical protein